MKNKNRWQWFALAIVAALLALRWIWGIVSINYYFERDYEEMQVIAEYFSLPENASEKGSISYKSKASVEQGNDYVKKVEDPNVRKAMIDLFDKGYRRIAFSANDTVYFQKNMALISGASRGYAISLRESEELKIQFLIEQKPMSKDGWYYYVEDYNEWRAYHYGEGWDGTD